VDGWPDPEARKLKKILLSFLIICATYVGSMDVAT